MLDGKPGAKPLHWKTRMTIVYRSEKKKIIQSQLNMVTKVIKVLQKIETTLLQKGFNAEEQSKAYSELLMTETDTEKKWRDEAEANTTLTKEQKQTELDKLEESFFMRRLINSEYFKQLKAMILTYDYI